MNFQVYSPYVEDSDTEVNDGTTIVFDTNHPMAGKDLNFNIELLEVEE